MLRQNTGKLISWFGALAALVILVMAGLAALAEKPNADSAGQGKTEQGAKSMTDSAKTSKTFQLSDEEWRKMLTPEQYEIMRKKGTERAFTGKYWNTKTPGVYLCAACGQELFSSDTKYESGSGWPSFWDPADSASVKLITDTSLGMTRTEVVCARCGSHLGHVFNDGPLPTGMRYCVNSASLNLAPADSADDSTEVPKKSDSE